MAANRIKGITIEIGGDTTKLDKALSGVNKTLRESQNELKDINKLLKLDPGNTDLLKQKYEALTKSIDGTKEKLKTLKDAQEQASQALARGDISQAQYDNLQREIIETENKLKSLEDEYKEFGSVSKQQIKQAGENMQELGGKISDIGGKVMPVSAAVTGVGVATVKMATDFEDAMAKVSTIADTQEVPFENLRKGILDLSNETGIAATDIAENVYNAISAGQSTADAVDFVSKATKLATAGFADSASALDVLTTTLNAYGMEASEVDKVSNMLINTQNMGKTTVGELSGYLGKVIPTAKDLNVGLEQLAASYAKLTANGIPTADATTRLNAMLNELGKTGTTVSDAIREETGKSFQELMQEGYSLADVLAIVDANAQKSGKSFGDMWSSSEAKQAGSVILDTTNKLGDFNAAVASMEQAAAGNATDEAFEKMQTTSFNAQKALNELKNTGIELGTTLLEALGPTLQSLLEKVSQVAEWFSGLDEGQKKMIVTIGLVVAAAGPLISIIGTLISVGGVLMGIVAGISLPVLAVVAAIAALIAIGVALYKNWDTIKEKAAELKENIASKWEEAKESIANSKLGEAYGKVMEAAKSTIKEKLANIKQAYDENGGGIKGAASAAAEAYRSYWTAGLTFVDKLTGGKLTDLKEKFTSKFDEIKQKISDTIEKIKADFQALKLKLPDIKLPHFRINGEFSLNPPKVPSIGVDWYAKAMNRGMILDSPTIFGAAGGKLLGAGEAGPEAIVGVNSLQNMIQDAVGTTGISTMVSLMQQYLPYLAEGKELRLDTGALVGGIAPAMNNALGQISAREARR